MHKTLKGKDVINGIITKDDAPELFDPEMEAEIEEKLKDVLEEE